MLLWKITFRVIHSEKKYFCCNVTHCEIRNRTSDRWWFRFCVAVNGHWAVLYAWVFVDGLLTDFNFIDWFKPSGWNWIGQTNTRLLHSRQHASQNFHTGSSAPFHAVLEAKVNLPCTVIQQSSDIVFCFVFVFIEHHKIALPHQIILLTHKVKKKKTTLLVISSSCAHTFSVIVPC